MFWNRKRHSARTIRVLTATRNQAVPVALAALEGETLRLERAEAISTAGVYRALPGCALAILDRGDLLPSPEINVDLLDRTLAQSGIDVVSGADFVAAPQSWLERAAAAGGLLDTLPPRAVMLTAYSGGVGRTTLALNLARYVAHTLRLPAAALELAFGPGALRARTDPTLPDLYDVLTQDADLGVHDGVDLLPVDYASARLLLERPDDVRDLFERIVAGHVLTVVDAAGANPLADVVLTHVNRVLVVGDGRPDALANAAALLEILDRQDVDAHLVLNRVDGLGDRVALAGVDAACTLPRVDHPDDDPRLAEALLALIYPGWTPQGKQ